MNQGGFSGKNMRRRHNQGETNCRNASSDRGSRISEGWVNMIDQVIVFGTLVVALAFFVYGRWRYDLVALMGLLVVVSAGIVTGEEAFLLSLSGGG